MERLTKNDPDFYRKISLMRRVRSGGKYFKDKEAARAAQAKGVQTRLRKSAQRAKKENV